MAERYDRGILQVQPTDDLKQLVNRLNDKLRLVCERIAKLEGRSGESTVKNSLTLRSDNYTFFDMESAAAGKAAFCSTSGTSRTFEIAKGARREADKQWVATDTGAVILQLKDDGTMIMYANTGLTVGAAFSPTIAITFPTGTAQHGLVSVTHTATGLTGGHVLTATGTTSFSFESPSEHAHPAIAVRAYNNASITVDTGAATLITLTSENYDTHGFHSGSVDNSRLTVPTGYAGYYRVTGRVRFAATATLTYRGLRIERNSAGTATVANLAGNLSAHSSHNQITDVECTCTIYLEAGDYVELFANTGENTTATYLDMYYDSPSLEMFRIGT